MSLSMKDKTTMMTKTLMRLKTTMIRMLMKFMSKPRAQLKFKKPSLIMMGTR